MVVVTTVTIAATNTAQALSSTRIPANWITLQSDPANVDPTYHGPPNVTTVTGQVISVGGGGGSPQYPPVSDVSPYELSRIYVIGTEDDIVRVMYLTR